MPIRVKCPNCKKVLSAKDHLAGKRVACVSCKHVLVLPAAPTPAPAAAPAAQTVPAAPAAPAVDADAVARAAFAEAPAKVEEDTAKPIVFECEFCEATIEAPADMAGKRMQCTNEECRQLVKVPLPKAEKPKDWRTMEKKGPSLAAINQPEKIDEAAWGSRTDKGNVTTTALKEAGVIEEPKARPVGPDVWVRRCLWVVGIAAVGVGLFYMGSRYYRDYQQKKFFDEVVAKLPKDPKELPPILAAEAHRGAGLLLIRDARLDKRAEKAKLELQKARGWLPDAKGSADHDLFLYDLALTQLALGGSEEQELDKSRISWKNTDLLKELQQTLQKIGASEAKAMAVRSVATRLLQKEQLPLAVGLTSFLSSGDGQPPMKAQEIALLLQNDGANESANLPKLPAAGTVPDRAVRDGYAEGYARKGDYAKAKEIAAAPGPVRDRMEALLGVAAIALEKSPDEAKTLTEDALALLRQEPRQSPWLMIQLARLAPRVGLGSDDTFKKYVLEARHLYREAKDRVLLEVFLAECDIAPDLIGVERVKTLREGLEIKDGPNLALAWEALARHNARLGNGAPVAQEVMSLDGAEKTRAQPLVHIGLALGEQDRQ